MAFAGTSQSRDVVTLAEALEQLQSDKIDDRRKGFENLKDILNYNRTHANLQKLTEKSIHAIFEALFRVNSSERASYVRGGKSTTKAASASRLTLGASVLRLTVTLFADQLRRKTVKALLGHIIQTLPVANGGYCGPLALDYLKSLNVILAYQPHVEHFEENLWFDVVDFCIEGIGTVEEDGVDSAAVTGRASRTPSFRTQALAFWKNTRAESIENVVEILGCLRSLVSAPNSPLLERARVLLTTIMEFLQHSPSITFGHHAAVQSINATLARVAFNASSLLQQILPDLISIIKSLWPRTRAEYLLTDELLICLMHLQAFLINAVESRRGDQYLANVESLLEVMIAEYCATRKEERGHLELMELGLDMGDRPTFETSPMQTPAFYLRRANTKSERNWAEIHFISIFIIWIDQQRSFSSSRRTRDTEDVVPSAKRPKMSRKLEEAIEETAVKSNTIKVYYLQILAFVANVQALTSEDLMLLLDNLTVQASHSNSDVASWALLVIGSCARHPNAKGSEFTNHWTTAWHLSVRLISSIPLCRAACHVLHALVLHDHVDYLNIADSIDAVWSSANFNGPGLLCDSAVEACLLMSALKTFHNPGAAIDSREQMIAWVCAKWTPSDFENKVYSDQVRREIPLKSIYEAFRLASRGKMDIYKTAQFGCLGSIGEAWLEYWKSSEVLEYLLLLTPGSLFPSIRRSTREELKQFKSVHYQSRDTLHPMILSYFRSELDKTYDVWRSAQTQTTINGDMVQVIFAFCIIGLMVCNTGPHRFSATPSVLMDNLNKLATDVISFSFKSHVYHHDRVDALFEAIYQFLPQLDNVKTIDMLKIEIQPLSSVFRCLREAIDNENKRLDERLAVSISHRDVFDAVNGSHIIEASSERPDICNRRNTPLQSSARSFHVSTSSFIALVACAFQVAEEDESSIFIPTTYVEYVLTLTEAEYLISWPVTKSLMNTALQLRPSDAEALIVHLGNSFIEPYAWSRCESALCLCLDVVIGTTTLWTDQSMESLAEAVTDVYEWFINATAKPHVFSSKVEISLADLLYELLNIRPDFAQSVSRPSVRTTLFSILKNGDICIKYHIAQRLPVVFSSFVVHQHESIFEDVHTNLPNDVDWTEGVAIRILAHTKLGSSWKPLLRRCLYHIFEIAGEGGVAEPFAVSSVKQLVKTLELKSPQELFTLFSPQLLYTWFTAQNLKTIPFRIFGYGSIKELLMGSKAEVLSQIIMRGGDAELKHLEALTGRPVRELLQTSFPQAIAYGLAKDVVTVSEGGGTSHDAESCIRDLLGKEEYLRLMEENLHLVVAYLLLRLDKEDQMERTLSKREGYEAASHVLRTMKSISSSDINLPTGQQPDFKPRAALEAIERACRRVSDAAKKGIVRNDAFRKNGLNAWTPLVLITVSRLILNDIHSVFGSFHACHAIRKLRIVISFAGSSATTGYPLEMLLHALQPFLTEKMCAADTIGIFQYLLDNGKESLLNNGSFVAGLCLSTFLKLQDFINSAQDSTTQESDHIATLSKARTFHGWLSRFLDNYSPQGMDVSLLSGFQSITDIARRISSPVTAFKSTPESKILLAILDDLQLPKPLLSRKVLELCFRTIFETFSAPDTFRDDVLGDEGEAKKYHLPIWKSLQYQFVSKNYRIWAGRILGRSFGHDGELASDVYAETQLKALSTMSDVEGGWLSSKKAITTFFVEELHSPSPEVVGLAEYSLQISLQGYAKTSERALLEGGLPPALTATLSSEDFSLLYNMPGTLQGARDITDCFQTINRQSFLPWICDLTIAVMNLVGNEPLFRTMPAILRMNESSAEHLLPFVLHLALMRRKEDENTVQYALSEGFQFCFNHVRPDIIPHVKMLLNAVLYLRMQFKPHERSVVDRNTWLTLDYYAVATAAAKCKMLKTALLFVDIAQVSKSTKSETEETDRSAKEADLLQEIFGALDEPDSFYGVEQKPNLDSVIDRHAFEGNGIQALLFRSAQVDSHSRRRLADLGSASAKLIQSLARVNLNYLTRNLAGGQGLVGVDEDVTEGAVNAALKLGQWDIPVPSSGSAASILYRTFQSASNASDIKMVVTSLENGIMDGLKQFQGVATNNSRSLSAISVMASLTETYELLASRSVTQMEEVIEKIKGRDHWMKVNRADVVSSMLISRAAFVGILGRSPWLQGLTHVTRRDTFRFEVDLELRSSSIFSTLGAFQESLSIITYLSDQIVPYNKANALMIDGAVKVEVANVLWERGEHVPSIQVLRDVVKSCDFKNQTLPVSRAEILAILGQRVSYARLENPSSIVEKYLFPAMNELQKDKTGPEMAQVFHEYASYCHNQLTNTDNVEEFRRIERFKRQKWAEIQELKDASVASKTAREKATAEKALKDAQKWYSLDKQEYDRLHANREDNLRQSLISYLQTLTASDAYNTDAIKFTALWYEFADSETANSAVRGVVDRVPSRKFAPLMNQLSSRLQQSVDSFQAILSSLIERICHDHPYHGMNHVYAGSKTTGGNDSQARSRNRGANDIASRLANDSKTYKIWIAFVKSNDLYMKMAKFKNEELKRANQKFLLRKIDVSRRVERDVPPLRVPPITMTVDIREDFDYTSTPFITGFKPEMSILGGLSAPKLLTAIDSTGKQHRQLFKGGSDDLRQDAIMEQVFDQVTDLLRFNKATRQRKLRIRTYKVVPLDATSGAIEFVQPTTSLLEYLNPAHSLYHPTEYNWKVCRDKIEQGQDLPQASRIKIFQEVKKRFTPVLRHFFFERFRDPDDWFDRRLAYTRSTAAISILGHVLGLGDRHCQNILLDTSTGEVVHIDLGVAFEAGRILPKPETVPFRLTRDIVDGFGVLGTEGVFRRCCEFTLDALRDNKDTIMTLLNVLRYDPLYSWSVSPLRAKRLQEEQQQQQLAEGTVTPSSSKPGTRRSSAMMGPLDAAAELPEPHAKKGDEGGEADRALSVVERKLAGGLSVAAAVNELIQQATDDRNLAVLFHGWAAYA